MNLAPAYASEKLGDSQVGQAQRAQLPKGFRFVIVRRVSRKLLWTYVKFETGGHWFLHREGSTIL